jgi:hypothetical protein
MKPLLALVTLTLTALIFEEKARQLAGEAQDAYGEAIAQASQAKQSLTTRVEQQPLLSLLIAAGLAYAAASIVPTRN